MDPTERDLAGLDAERPLPRAFAARLEAALLEEARDSGDETAGLLAGVDGPLPLPPRTRRAIEQALIAAPARNRWRVPVGIAAAVLFVTASVAALRNDTGDADHTVAAGPVTTVAPRANDGVDAATSASATTTQAPSALEPVVNPPAGASAGSNGGDQAQARTAEPSAAAAPTAGASALSAGPSVTSVEPAGGPVTGGTTVTVRGSGFTGATGVRFGSTAGTGFEVFSDTEIRAVSPPASGPGQVDVVVTFSNGATTPASAEARFTYTSP
jgi:hypothetical protein